MVLSFTENKIKLMNAWIYVGADCDKLHWCKVGKTSGDLKTRHRSPQNPNYFIYGAFEIKDNSVDAIENFLHDKLNCYDDIRRFNHFGTGNPSECYEFNPHTMMDVIENLILDDYPSSVWVNVYDRIDYRYMCPDELQKWWSDDDKRETNKWIGLEEPSVVTPTTRCVSEFDRLGVVLSQDRYEAKSITPLIELGYGKYIDQETGDTIDFDDMDDDDYDDDH
ncbi:hypothetical protein [Photobacterium iliopiscarium]|uniref:Uncharacterized protein n=1 Tax=Photobacterium iliopiscarium TaxID=56192 RepID=A0A2T3MMP0_9GAMM|nr:hypothetical protein [Photobacterium iliopiscarium]PSV97857.1 hypothetical protein C9I88_07245 [Photobacterium iliopiscarium]